MDGSVTTDVRTGAPHPRVRDAVRDAAAVAAFSLVASSSFALALLVMTRWIGRS